MKKKMIMRKIIKPKTITSVSQSNTQFTPPTPSVNSTTLGVADEIKKYKELLDTGVITEEEFEAKKKQLLGL